MVYDAKSDTAETIGVKECNSKGFANNTKLWAQFKYNLDFKVYCADLPENSKIKGNRILSDDLKTFNFRIIQKPGLSSTNKRNMKTYTKTKVVVPTLVTPVVDFESTKEYKREGLPLLYKEIHLDYIALD